MIFNFHVSFVLKEPLHNRQPALARGMHQGIAAIVLRG